MTDPLKELSAPGSLHLARRPEPAPDHQRGPAGPHRHSCVVGVTTNPSIFAAALSPGRHLQRADQGPGRGGPDRGRGGVRPDHRGRSQRLRHHAPGLRGHRWPGRSGLHRGRPAPGPRHRRDAREARELRDAVDRPNCPSRSRPPWRACRRSPGPRRGDQHQRDPDLLPGPLSRGHGRLSDRARTGPASRP